MSNLFSTTLPLPPRSDTKPTLTRPLRIVIADDEEPSRRRLLDLLDDLREGIPHEVVADVANGKAAIEAAIAHQADIVLLDINMPVMDGLEAARHFLTLETAPSVIFITAFDQHALQAFELQALDYLLKPVRRERLLTALQRAQPLTGAALDQLPRGARRFFSVNERGRLILVPSDEVIYLRAELKYLTLITADREYLIEDSLTRIADEFGDRFVRIHRNCLVRADWIDAFERDFDASGEAQWVITLRGRNERLAVSRRQHAVVRKLAKQIIE